MATMMKWSFIFFLYAGLVAFCVCELEVEVELEQGLVRGHPDTSHTGRKFLSFMGIPYAKPPVGDLRFADPEPAGKWDGVLEGSKTYTCAQLMPIPYIWGPTGTEDCLYLYVHVPGESINKDANFPVVIHIHGGAFMLGSPKIMALPDLIMEQDVIYVTMNYRLGVLGFLSTEDGVVSGNMGLKDQSLALKWIKENIRAFGGDPDSITLTGVSAGGASVHYHYLSPMSNGLFSRGISHSGTALQSWALTENPLEKAKFVARNVSCESDSTDEMVACLRSKSYKELIIAIDGLFVLISGVPPTPFGPVIEKGGANPFIDENPYKLLKEGKVYDVPWINTNVKDEGIIPVGIYVHLNKMDYIADNWNTVMPAGLDFNDTVDDTQKEEVVDKIKKFYYGEDPVTKDNYENLIKMYNDRIFFIDSELATRTHAAVVKSPVYFYFYKFVPETNFPFRGIKPGVSHGLDSKLIHQWMILTRLKKNEEKMMFLLIEFMKIYASTGVPEVGGVKWEPVQPGNEEINYLEINNPDDIQMKTMKQLAPKEFWSTLPIQENDHIY